MAKKKKKPNKKRNLNQVLAAKREIDLRTKSEPTKNLKHSRKIKHKNKDY